MISLQDFPKVIEPLANAIELQMASVPGQTLPGLISNSWRQFRRHEPPCGFSPPHGCVHLFGPDCAWDKLPVMLGYDAAGRLRYNFTRGEDGDWEVDHMPEEITGVAIGLPSIRLIFKNDEDRQMFLRVLSRLEASNRVQLAGNPVLLNVAQ